MAQNDAVTAAERFESLDERVQSDLKHDAWAQAVEAFREEHPDWYEAIDSSEKVSWDDMELEVYVDENGRRYFHIVTGVVYAPGHANGKRRHERVFEFMDEYRDRLNELVRDHDA